MKTVLFAAALSVSGLAIAQTQTNNGAAPATTTTQGTAQPDDADAPTTTTTTTTTTTPQDTAQPSGQTVDDPLQSTGPQGVTQQGTDPNGQATAPAGTNMGTMGTGSGMAMPAPNQNAAFTPRAAAGEYPPCSRTVTDSCVQTYERGGTRSRRRGR